MCCARQVSCKGICHTLGFLPELVSTYHSAFVTHNESLCIHKRMCKGHLATIPLKTLLCVCAQSYPTLCEPVDSTLEASLSMEFSRQEYWSVLPFPTPGDLPYPGIKPISPTSPALAEKFFTTVPPGKPISE